MGHYQIKVIGWESLKNIAIYVRIRVGNYNLAECADVSAAGFYLTDYTDFVLEHTVDLDCVYIQDYLWSQSERTTEYVSSVKQKMLIPKKVVLMHGAPDFDECVCKWYLKQIASKLYCQIQLVAKVCFQLVKASIHLI